MSKTLHNFSSCLVYSYIHSSMIIFLDRQQIFSLVYECREFPHCFLYAHHQIMFWLIVHQAKFSQAKVSAYTKNIWADISCAPTCQKSRWLLLIKKTSQAFPTSIPDCILCSLFFHFLSPYNRKTCRAGEKW